MNNTFNINSNDNALFVTEQCNNHCLMCCQPPKKEDDIDALYENNLKKIHTAPKDLSVLGITGGEPTLLGDKLVTLFHEIRLTLPNTTIQLLSNGRKFKDKDYTARIVDAAGGNFFVGIPLHSDYAGDHNTIAGALHSYEETLLGLYNLAMLGAEIELRVVINALNFKRLPQMSEFIFKNLPFISWVAFMGMERTGFAIKNHSSIWVEPHVFVPYLQEAVRILDDWKIDTAIYNLPLCLLPEFCWRFAKRSISDWKTKYAECCGDCSKRKECCGLFGTSIRPYEGLEPV